jgi:hypothetical protein
VEFLASVKATQVSPTSRGEHLPQLSEGLDNLTSVAKHRVVLEAPTVALPDCPRHIDATKAILN